MKNITDLEMNTLDSVNRLPEDKSLLPESILQRGIMRFFQSNKSSKTINKRNFGKSLVFCFFRGEPLFTIGPHWYMFLCMFTTFLVSGITISFLVAKQSSSIAFYLMLYSTSIQCFVYLCTSLLNPGIVSSSEVIDEEKLKTQGYCRICKVKNDFSIYHCQDCDVCIKGFDHHCPWTGKCIGEGNIKCFNIFITLTCVFILSAIFISIHLV